MNEIVKSETTAQIGQKEKNIMYLKIWDCQFSVWESIHGYQIHDESEMSKSLLTWAKKNFSRNQSGWELIPDELTAGIEFEKPAPLEISNKKIDELVIIAKENPEKKPLVTRILGEDGYYTDELVFDIGTGGRIPSWSMYVRELQYSRTIWGDDALSDEELTASYKKVILFHISAKNYRLID